MIVPSMTLTEIRRELYKDVPILKRKIIYVTDDMKKHLTKQSTATLYERFFDYNSKYKNQWIYRIGFLNMKTNNSMILMFHNGKGHAGIIVTSELQLVYHTAHFFQRFNERCNLGFTDYKDVVHAYLHDNSRLQFTTLDQIEPGVFTIFSVINKGIILGTFNSGIDLVKANTFLPNHMLNKNQNELKNELAEKLNKYKDHSQLLN